MKALLLTILSFTLAGCLADPYAGGDDGTGSWYGGYPERYTLYEDPHVAYADPYFLERRPYSSRFYGFGPPVRLRERTETIIIEKPVSVAPTRVIKVAPETRSGPPRANRWHAGTADRRDHDRAARHRNRKPESARREHEKPRDVRAAPERPADARRPAAATPPRARPASPAPPSVAARPSRPSASRSHVAKPSAAGVPRGSAASRRDREPRKPPPASQRRQKDERP